MSGRSRWRRSKRPSAPCWRARATPFAFERHRAERRAALEIIERLEWAEQAERERAEQERLAELRRALEEAQQRAYAAMDEAAGIAGELAGLAEQVAAKVRAMQRLKREVDRAVPHESYAVRDGYLDQPTVGGKLAVEPETVTLLLKSAKELCKVAVSDWQLASIRADQRREL